MRIILSLLFFVVASINILFARNAASSQLASGLWVRVEADTTGIFEISHSRLRTLGFDKPAEVAVYGYGAVMASGQTGDAMPDYITPTAFMHTADGRLLFYAEGDVRATLKDGYEASFVRNCFDTGSVYFLSDVKPAVRPEDYPKSTTDTGALDSHFHIDMIEREVQSPGRIGTVFHSIVLKPGDSERYTFHIENYKTLPTGSMVVFRYDIAVNSQFVTRVVTKLSENVKEVVNTPLQSITNMLSNRLYNICEGNVIFMPPAPGAFDDTNVDIDICIASVFRGTYAAVDRAYIIYPRSNRLGCGELFMNFTGMNEMRSFTVSGADSDVVVWNVSNPSDIRGYTMAYDSVTRTASGTLGHENAANLRLVAFNPSDKFRAPLICGALAAQNLRASEAPDYLIVTTSTLLPAAEELADIHRSLQGLDVAVVRQEDIYNEFSSGMRMPEAIRRLVKMYVDSSPGKLRYVLLYGPTEWDVRHITGLNGDCLPSYVCEDPLLARDLPTAFHSDLYFGMTSDDFNPMAMYKASQSVSVGRLPVADIDEAHAVNEKSRRRLLDVPSPSAFLHALKFSDDGDDRAHFDYSEEFASFLLAGNNAMTVSRADNHLYPWTNDVAVEATRKLRECLREGIGLMYYTGHGSATGLTAQQIYNVHFIATEDYRHAPLSFFSSCITFPYDGRQLALVQRMVFNAKGGAIGAVGACRPVYLEQNRPLSNCFAQAYAAARPGDCGADIFRAARERIVSGGITSALGNNTLCYNYCGDPALPLGVPDLKVDFAAADGSMDFRSLDDSVLKGRIVDDAGEPEDDFNGTALIRVYDLPQTLRTLQRNGDDGDPMEIEADDCLLAEYSAEVSSGEFSLDFILPRVTGDGLRRIVVTAVDSNSGKTAAGMRRDFAVADAVLPRELPAPDILEFSTDTETVSPAFTARARIAAGALGLAPQSALAPGISVTVDGSSARVNVSRRLCSDGIIDATLDFSPLAPGAHCLVLRAVGSSGETVERALRIFVAERTVDGNLSVDGADPARKAVVFSLDAPDGADATLVIVSADGKTVLRREGCVFPFVWNLEDSQGRQVDNGTYRAWVLLKSCGAFGSTEKAEITVLKPVQGNKN